MRMMLRATMDTQKANELVKRGEVADILKSVIDRLNPEATYFAGNQGRRSCVLVFDMEDSAQLPAICEPLFQHMGADITIEPCMNLEDLQRGLAASQGNR
ncbi:DUF3303 family protein [Streptomyces apocyni]|uniref:DUF3303 family protein n=1 Tax=Streptomyces apocyni TaxID=2654677 RepID=UPI001E397DD9|nr:DUF3303 family protein [Streptomyces apocyni]